MAVDIPERLIARFRFQRLTASVSDKIRFSLFVGGRISRTASVQIKSFS